MINMKVGIGFVIRNLTEIEWAKLQDYAQDLVQDRVFHNISQEFGGRQGKVITIGDQDVYATFRRDFDENTIEFLFVGKQVFQPGELE